MQGADNLLRQAAGGGVELQVAGNLRAWPLGLCLGRRVGQNLARGAELCVVADVGTVTVEVAIAEEDASRLAPKILPLWFFGLWFSRSF